MKIYLLNQHEALIAESRDGVVTVIPPTDGRLSVAGEELVIRSGETPEPCLADGDGSLNATYITHAGIRYRVISPKVIRGRLISRVDPVKGYVEARLAMDRVEKRTEELAEHLRLLEGAWQHDALGFLIKREE